MRGRQFLMKDLYTFDIDVPSAKRTYEEVSEVYNAFFSHLQVKYVRG